MKRITALLFSLLFMCSLAACGSQREETENKESSSAESAEPSETESARETIEDL